MFQETLFNLSVYEFEFILREVLNKTYSDYLIYGLSQSELEKIKPYIDMAQRMPVEYIFNKAFFRNLELFVNKDVLIPRNETEELVDICLKLIKENEYSKLLEIGIGSGAISISLAMENKEIHIFANDISFKALEVAQKNINKYSLNNRIILLCGNSIQPIKSKFDMIIWNIPYVLKSEFIYLSEKVKIEPEMALIYNEETIIKFLNAFRSILNKNGACILEISNYQAELVSKFNFKILNDNYGNCRFAIYK